MGLSLTADERMQPWCSHLSRANRRARSLAGEEKGMGGPVILDGISRG